MSWWAIAKRVWQQTGEDKISILAAGVAFYSLLPLFPALAALVSVYGLVADPSWECASAGAIAARAKAELATRSVLTLSNRKWLTRT